jgi:hypothetical protein
MGDRFMKENLRARAEKIITHSKGPTVTEKEAKDAANMMREYFNSKYFTDFIEQSPIKTITINVSIYGSLVTGFASKYSKYSSMPTDHQRVSDVDIGIVIDDDSLNKIQFENKRIFDKGTYYGPFTENKAQRLGPFQKIFGFVKGLSFAKRSDRKIGFAVVNKHFYDTHLAKDPHILLFEDRVHVR